MWGSGHVVCGKEKRGQCGHRLVKLPRFKEIVDLRRILGKGVFDEPIQASEHVDDDQDREEELADPEQGGANEYGNVVTHDPVHEAGWGSGCVTPQFGTSSQACTHPTLVRDSNSSNRSWPYTGEKFYAPLASKICPRRKSTTTCKGNDHGLSSKLNIYTKI